MLNVIDRGTYTIFELNRPPVNVLNVAMMEEMVTALDGARRDPAVKVLVLRGEGKCFSAGMDVGDHLPGRVEGPRGRGGIGGQVDAHAAS